MSVVGDIAVTMGANVRPFQTGLGQMKGAVSGFVSSALKLAAPLGAAFTLTSAISSARENALAQKKLQSVLASTGGAAGVTADEIFKLAGSMQATTNFSDDLITNGAAVMATFTNIKGDVFKSALTAAADLSSVLGTDLQSSVIQIGKALNDPTRGITALSRAGVSFTEQQKAQIKALQESGDLIGAQKIILAELENEFGGAAKAMADPFTIMKNAAGDVLKTIGTLMLPAVNAVASGITSVLVPATDMLKAGFAAIKPILSAFWDVGVAAFTAVKEMAVGLWDTIMSGLGMTGTSWSRIFSQVKEFMIAFYRVIEFGLLNWKDVGALVVSEVQLKFFTFVENIKHFFTSDIPTVLSWFLGNWRDIFFTLFDATSTVFINLGQNIRSAMKEIWDFIASGGTDAMEITWTPLLDGFKSTIKEMPQFAAREMTATEKELKSGIDAIRSKLGTGFKSFLDRKNTKLPTIDVTKPTPGGGEKTPDGPDSQSKSMKQEAKGISALQRGSVEAYKAIVAARGSGQRDIVNNTKATVKEIQGLRKDIVKNSPRRWADDSSESTEVA